MHAWKIILGALHPLPLGRVPMKFSAQPPSPTRTPSPRLRGAWPNKGFAQLFHAVLGTIRSVADVVDHDHDYDDVDVDDDDDGMERGRGEEEKGAGMAMVDEGSICCTSAAASSRADVGRAVSTRPQTQSFENEGNLESHGIFLPWVGGAWVKKGRGRRKGRRRRGEEGRQRGKKLVLRSRFLRISLMPSSIRGDAIQGGGMIR